MGLSRNKVAVSEGAAGSPPFYGESGRILRESSVFRSRFNNRLTRVHVQQRHNCSCYSIFEDHSSNTYRGCSSAGRAPALQAGGQGFDSLHLHQKSQRDFTSSLFTLHSSPRKKERERGREWIESGDYRELTVCSSGG